MSAAWFDENTAGLVGAVAGSAAGLWGAAVGCLAGWLVPRGRGRGVVFGLLWLGVAVGAASLVAGVAALAGGQPYHVWYPLGCAGLLLTALSLPFVFVVRHRYSQAEVRRMAEQDFA